MLARTIAAVITDTVQLADRLQNTEQGLRRELFEYNKDPSAGAMQGLSPIKVRVPCVAGNAANSMLLTS